MTTERAFHCTAATIPSRLETLGKPLSPTTRSRINRKWRARPSAKPRVLQRATTTGALRSDKKGRYVQAVVVGDASSGVSWRWTRRDGRVAGCSLVQQRDTWGVRRPGHHPVGPSSILNTTRAPAMHSAMAGIGLDNNENNADRRPLPCRPRRPIPDQRRLSRPRRQA